ncbi:hypothetical protein ACLOJK_027237 [Asimina triloba]
MAILVVKMVKEEKKDDWTYKVNLSSGEEVTIKTVQVVKRRQHFENRNAVGRTGILTRIGAKANLEKKRKFRIQVTEPNHILELQEEMHKDLSSYLEDTDIRPGYIGHQHLDDELMPDVQVGDTCQIKGYENRWWIYASISRMEDLH